MLAKNQQINGPAVQQTVESEEEIDLTRWIEAFRRRKKLLFVVLGSVITMSILLYLITPKRYQASTTIQIERKTASVVNTQALMSVESYADAQSFYPTQYKLLESRGLAERVVRELHLAQDPVFNPKEAELAGTETDESITSSDDERKLSELARKLLKQLKVKPIRNTRLVEIAYQAPTSELAARIANGIAEAYINWGIELRSATVGRASSFLSSQTEELKKEIQAKEAELQSYSRRTDIVALDPNSNVVLQRLEALNKDYTAALSERIQKEAEYYSLKNSPKESVADTYSSGLIAQLRRDLMDLKQDYAKKLNTYKPEWPAMQELKADIDKSQQNLEETINQKAQEATQAARTAYETALRRESSLRQELETQKSAAMKLNSAAVEYNNLKVEVETRRQLLNNLLRQQSDTGVASRLEGTRNSNVVVIDRAIVPEKAYRPSLPRNLALGLVLGLMLGIGAVLAVELLDRTLHTPDDVERVLGLPVLGVIPDVSQAAGGYGYGYGYGYGHHSSSKKKLKIQRKKGRTAEPDDARPITVELLPHDNPRAATAEAYRTVRTSVLLSSAGGLQSVVITSATSGEGKTALSSNLAVVLAQLGQTVLLVDADMRKARMHEIFKISNRTGLVNHLATDTAIDDIIKTTEVPGLSLVPAGPAPPNPSELLSSKKMRNFVQSIKERFDYIVFDSPPVLAVTDASVVGTLVDGTILCVAAGHVTREAAEGAVDRMSIGNVHIIGAVLNKFQAKSEGYRGYRYQRIESEADASDSIL